MKNKLKMPCFVSLKNRLSMEAMEKKTGAAGIGGGRDGTRWNSGDACRRMKFMRHSLDSALVSLIIQSLHIQKSSGI
jgi:hypothetical protein